MHCGKTRTLVRKCRSDKNCLPLKTSLFVDVNSSKAYLFNLLRLIKLDSASEDQIHRIVPDSIDALPEAMDNGYITEKHGKYTLTEEGYKEFKELKNELIRGE